RRFVGRHRLGVTAAAAIFLLTLAFAAAMAVAAYRLDVQSSRLETEARTAREVVRFLGGLFEGAEPAVHRGQELTARELLDRGAAIWESSGGQPPGTRAALAAAIGKAYLELSLLPEARRYLEPSLVLRQEVGEASSLAESHRLLARLEWAESRYEQAADYAAAATALLEPRREPLAKAESLALEGRSLASLGRLDEAQEVLQRSLALLGPDPKSHPALAGVIVRELASLTLYRGQPERAGEQIRQAIELLEAAHGRLHPEVFEARRLLAATLDDASAAGDARPGVRVLEELLEDQRAFFGGDHEQIVWTLTDLGSEHIGAARYPEAVGYYRQAKVMQEALFDQDHMVLAVIESGLGQAMWRQGEHEESLPAFRRALEISRQHVDPGSYDLAFPTLYLGEALAGTGRCEEALPLLREAHASLEKALSSSVFGTFSARWEIARCEGQLGEAADAEARMRSILAEVEAAGYEKKAEYRLRLAEWRAILEDLDAQRPRPPEAPAASAAGSGR
ncbi:MAG: tetratricopeptide repeat protein, partial [Acidobacteria bacterium]|nr:tetratricopeptide repeat protein [Acidobacteriota bacterium]